MNIPKARNGSPRPKQHDADIGNPADYKQRKRPARQRKVPGMPENEKDAAVAEIPFPGRDELSPEIRPNGGSSAGSPLSVI